MIKAIRAGDNGVLFPAGAESAYLAVAGKAKSKNDLKTQE
jgi:hypothetical protein